MLRYDYTLDLDAHMKGWFDVGSEGEVGNEPWWAVRKGVAANRNYGYHLRTPRSGRAHSHTLPCSSTSEPKVKSSLHTELPFLRERLVRSWK